MQEVIVYRNPVEAAFWKFIGSGDAFPIMVAMVLFFATILLTDGLFKRLIKYNNRWNNEFLFHVRDYGCIYTGIIVAGLTIWIM